MATIIPARKPIYNNQFADEFNWWVTVTYSKPIPSTSTMLIIKRSPTAGDSVNLRLNVSPLAKDYFRHSPNLTVPTAIQEPVLLEKVTVSLANAGYGSGTFATYDAYDGWETYLSNVIGVSSMTVTKKLFRNSPAYISAKPFNTDNILWMLNDGTNYTATNTQQATEKNLIFPVIHPSLTVTDAHTGLSVIGRDVSNNELWRLEYEFECPYDESNTIGFVNKYGVWEFIDITGRKKTKLNTDRNSYTRYSDGVKQDYNVNGQYEYDFNTGWVERGFEDVMENLLLSEAVIIYSGDGNDPINITIDTKSLDIQDSRANKMVNYNFKATVGKSIIPIT